MNNVVLAAMDKVIAEYPVDLVAHFAGRLVVGGHRSMGFGDRRRSVFRPGANVIGRWRTWTR